MAVADIRLSFENGVLLAKCTDEEAVDDVAESGRQSSPSCEGDALPARGGIGGGICDDGVPEREPAFGVPLVGVE